MYIIFSHFCFLQVIMSFNPAVTFDPYDLRFEYNGKVLTSNTKQTDYKFPKKPIDTRSRGGQPFNNYTGFNDSWLHFYPTNTPSSPATPFPTTPVTPSAEIDPSSALVIFEPNQVPLQEIPEPTPFVPMSQRFQKPNQEPSFENIISGDLENSKVFPLIFPCDLKITIKRLPVDAFYIGIKHPERSVKLTDDPYSLRKHNLAYIENQGKTDRIIEPRRRCIVWNLGEDGLIPRDNRFWHRVQRHFNYWNGQKYFIPYIRKFPKKPSLDQQRAVVAENFKRKWEEEKEQKKISAKIKKLIDDRKKEEDSWFQIEKLSCQAPSTVSQTTDLSTVTLPPPPPSTNTLTLISPLAKVIASYATENENETDDEDALFIDDSITLSSIEFSAIPDQQIMSRELVEKMSNQDLVKFVVPCKFNNDNTVAFENNVTADTIMMVDYLRTLSNEQLIDTFDLINDDTYDSCVPNNNASFLQ